MSAARRPLAPPSKAKGSDTGTCPGTTWGHTNRVLVVEDSPVDRQLLADQFRLLSIEVSFATSGGEAAAKLASEPIDVVFLDYLLGSELGLEIISKLRDRGETRPIFLMSSCPTDALESAAMEAGATGFVGKEAMGPHRLEATLRAIVG